VIELQAQLVTAFHHELVTRDWLAALSAFLDELPSLHGRSGTGVVRPFFNEERYMGPQSACKYMFELEFTCVLGPMLEEHFRGHVNYRPVQLKFRLKELRNTWLWASEAAEFSREELAAIARAGGALVDTDLRDFAPEPDWAPKAVCHQSQLLMGTSAGKKCVVLAHPLNLTRVWGSHDQPVLPLLGDPARVRAAIDATYGPLAP